MAKLPFETIISNAPLQGGPNFEDVTGDILVAYGKEQARLQEKINGLIKGKLELSGAWYDALNDVRKVEWTKIIDNIRENKNKDDLRRFLREASNKVGIMSDMNGYDLDHRDITYVNSRIALTINVLQGARKTYSDLQFDPEGIEEYDVASRRMLGLTPEQQAADQKGSLIRGTGTPEQSLTRAIQQLQKVLAVMERVAATINSTGAGVNYEDEIRALEQAGIITLEKEKYVNAMDGAAEAIFRFETPDFNQGVKGREQARAGNMRRAVESSSTAFVSPQVTGDAELNRIFNRVVNSTMQVEGSDRIDAQLLQQLEDAFFQRKSKLQRTKKKKEKTVKGIKVKRGKAPALKKKGRNIAKELKAFAAYSGVQKTRRRKPTGQRRLNIFKENINAKLGAQVTKNMVRPALEPRSGTFAGSVKLESLVQGPKTIVGEYSYQEDPYSTFENSSRWPTGYNPKPLITRSIRELATKALGEKFTLRKSAI